MNPFVFEFLVVIVITLIANGLLAAFGRKFIIWYLAMQAYVLVSPIALWVLIPLSGNIIRYGGDRIAGSYTGYVAAWALTIIVILLLRLQPRRRTSST
jgi:hypothetical protein